MTAREWMMSDRNMADQPIESFTELNDEERANLALLVRQCRGWSSQNIDEVVAVMAKDGVVSRYHPAAGARPCRDPRIRRRVA